MPQLGRRCLKAVRERCAHGTYIFRGDIRRPKRFRPAFGKYFTSLACWGDHDRIWSISDTRTLIEMQKLLILRNMKITIGIIEHIGWSKWRARCRAVTQKETSTTVAHSRTSPELMIEQQLRGGSKLKTRRTVCAGGRDVTAVNTSLAVRSWRRNRRKLMDVLYPTRTLWHRTRHRWRRGVSRYCRAASSVIINVESISDHTCKSFGARARRGSYPLIADVISMVHQPDETGLQDT